ncbi:hypothetical protein BDP27DRAFT_1422540 [Rhodocollybia butyracea]|uniref:Uncharacterized protein n=1 Tax=Rhodocollybia butyracea TaxID=206335 RepID=A0A9P5PRD9_9AGAR|nr:hypothetical protein BDP27DRAFT_1422540 [Rhodocollybia butyracea]
MFLARHPEGYPAQHAVTLFPASLTGAGLSMASTQSPSLPFLTPPSTPPQGQRVVVMSSESSPSISQLPSRVRSYMPSTLESEFKTSLMLTMDSLDSLLTSSSQNKKSPVYAVKELGSLGATVYVDRKRAKKAVWKHRAEGTLHSVQITPSLTDAFDFAAGSGRPENVGVELRLQAAPSWLLRDEAFSWHGEENILYSLFEHVAEVLPSAPWRPQEMQFYLSLYWTAKIKPIYMEEIACQVKAAKEAGQKKPAMINIANDVTKRLWAAESEEVKAEVRAMVDEHHAQKTKEYNFARENPGTKTGSDYYLALVSLSALLQKLVDACQDYFGMATTIMLCRPIPESNGNVDPSLLPTKQSLLTRPVLSDALSVGVALNNASLGAVSNILSTTPSARAVPNGNSLVGVASNHACSTTTSPDSTPLAAVPTEHTHSTVSSMPLVEVVPNCDSLSAETPLNGTPLAGIPSLSTDLVLSNAPSAGTSLHGINGSSAERWSFCGNISEQYSFGWRAFSFAWSSSNSLYAGLVLSNAPSAGITPSGTPLVGLTPLDSTPLAGVVPTDAPSAGTSLRSTSLAGVVSLSMGLVTNGAPSQGTSLNGTPLVGVISLSTGLVSSDAPSAASAGVPTNASLTDISSEHARSQTVFLQAKVGLPAEAVSEDVASLEKEWPLTELPDWIQKFYTVFREESCGKIPLTFQPVQIAAWFKNCRNPKKMMKVWSPEDGSAWREEWWAYWHSIQPMGHVEKGKLICPESLNWDELRDKGGANRLLLIMLTLLWWGHDTHTGTCKADHPENWGDWRLAVGDVWYVWIVSLLME